MFQRILAALTKIGLLSEGVAVPRRLPRAARYLVSMIAVGYSYFFVHVSYFGMPIAEVFKGVYILGVSLLCLLVYKGRHQPISKESSWLDEIFSFLASTLSVSLWTLWLFWHATGKTMLWRDFAGAGAEWAAGLGAGLGALLYWKEGTRKEIGEGYTPSDCLFILSIAMVVVWWQANNETLVVSLGRPTHTEVVIFAGLLVAASMDVARRVMGPVIPLIGLAFLVYTFAPVANRMPGLLHHGGFTISQISEFLLVAADGMTGLIIEVFATYVVIFVILGAFLERTGLGTFFIDATFRMTGRRTGGPGLTAVISSGLFGMISGSGVANVVTTGTFTIPLMRRVGYRPEFAAAVEAAASTGGGFMPPVMGAGAFLLAQFTETNYSEVAKVAAIPAVLYFISVGYLVYIRAVRHGLHGVPASELPSWSSIVPRSYLLLPIPAMVYYLIVGDSAFLAAFKAILLIILLKALDLLSGVRTENSSRLKRPMLALSVLAGVTAYVFGETVGPPFTWFKPAFRDIHLGDALFWALSAYLVLKVGEILWGRGRPDRSAATGQEPDPPVLLRLRECLWELAKSVWNSLEMGAKNFLLIGCITVVLGIIFSAATQSDLPGRFSSLMIEFSFGLLPLTIFWVILTGYIVGMGLPILAAYVVLVIFGVTAMTNLGVPTLTAHLICFWVSVVSSVTPPVAITAYAASAIAMSDPIRTSFQALKLASWIFIMPFLFVYTPILLGGTPLDIALTVLACLAGIVAWGGMMEGYLIRETNSVEWGLLTAASAFLLLPLDHLVIFITPVEGEHPYVPYGIGAILLSLAYVLQRRRGGWPPTPVR